MFVCGVRRKQSFVFPPDGETRLQKRKSAVAQAEPFPGVPFPENETLAISDVGLLLGWSGDVMCPRCGRVLSTPFLYNSTRFGAIRHL